MAISIETNMLSQNLQRLTMNNNSVLETNFKRLSSGLRVNSAKDDPGNFSISTRMAGQIKGLNQALRNVNDGISMAQVADGALDDILYTLQRMRDLATQATNPTNNTEDISSISQEFNQLRDHITEVASSTEFNGTKLLDGSLSKNIQTSQNSGGSTQITTANNMIPTQMGIVTQKGWSNGDFNSGLTGWTAENKQVRFGTDTIAGQNTPSDNNWPILPVLPPNNQATDQHVPTSQGQKSTTSSTNIPDATGTSVQLRSTAIKTQAGYDIVRGPYIYSDTPVALQANDAVSFQWKAEGGDDAYDVFAYLVDVNNGNTQELLNETGPSTNASTPWQTVNTNVAANGQYRFVFVSGTYDFSGGKAAGAQLFIDNVTVTQTLASSRSLADVTLQSTSDINEAINIIDNSIDDASEMASSFGVLQNSMESAASNIRNMSQIHADSQSRICDADYALEASNMARNSIVQQAGIRMLAQANLLPQRAVELLYNT